MEILIVIVVLIFLFFLIVSLIGGIAYALIMIPVLGVAISTFMAADTILNFPTFGGDSAIWEVLSSIMFMLLHLALLDCIIDFFDLIKLKIRTGEISKTFYQKLAKENEGLYYYKALWCILPAGIIGFYYFVRGDGFSFAEIWANRDVIIMLLVLPRAVFPLGEFLFRILGGVRKLTANIKSDDFFKLSSGRIVPGNLLEAIVEDFSIFGEKYFLVNGFHITLISNEEIKNEEETIIKEMLKKENPSKSEEKMEEIINQKLKDFPKGTTYISPAGYAKFSEQIDKLLQECSVISPRKFVEKKLPEKYLEMGVEFFVIKAFSQGVAEGRIIDMDVSDDILVRHAYKHTLSNVPMKSTVANDNPALALDDDDDF
ncbi:MAG: hypothetical protein FWG64_11210 [Firmicutes bacterium]|nr:hypothetical protein [Bacillota bacterium]